MAQFGCAERYLLAWSVSLRACRMTSTARASIAKEALRRYLIYSGGRSAAAGVDLRPKDGRRTGDVGWLHLLSIEDETGIANAIIEPELYERHRALVTYAKALLITGTLQNVDRVIHVRARHMEALELTDAPIHSHDYH